MIFREMQRKNKQLSEGECISILKTEKRGVLSVVGDNGYPYGMPMNHFYNEDDGCIYFHCGKQGHRTDSLKQDNKASFCVCDSGIINEGEWALEINSVIAFGKIDIIDNTDIIADISYKLSRKFTDDEEYIKNEIDCFAHETLILKMSVEHLCGKKVKEA